MVLIRVHYGFLGNYLGISFFISPSQQSVSKQASPPAHCSNKEPAARLTAYYRRQAPRFNRNRST